MPTHRNGIKFGAQRRIIARLMLELFKMPTETHLKTNHYASKCDDVILMCAILIGQVEGKPMTAAKLAEYAGMPRPTVVRKLGAFQLAGMVDMIDGKPVGVSTHMNTRGIGPTIEGLIRSIHKASAELSILDGRTVADKDRT